MSTQTVGPSRRYTGSARWLEANSGVWVERGIITGEQRQLILDDHDVAAAGLAGRRAYARLVTILATLGAILAGTGVILFFASNWEEIPRYAKLALVLSAVVISYSLAFWLKYAWGYERVGGAVLFLGTFLYGAGVFLVAQVYNMPVDNPALLGWWFIGVLPLGYAVRSRAMVFLAIIVGTSALGWKLTQWQQMDVPTTLAMYATIGAGVYALGLLQAWRSKTAFFSMPYSLLGILIAFSCTYFLSFDEDVIDWYWRSNAALPVGAWVIAGAGAGMSAVAVVVALVFRTARKEERVYRLLDACGGAVLAGGALALLLHPFDTVGPYVVLFNALLFSGALWAIVLGLLGKREGLLNFGVAFFGLGIATRYVDIVWGMMDTSLFFMTGGLALLALGFVLERARRKLIGRWRAQEVLNVA